jgi:hypothetical protein
LCWLWRRRVFMFVAVFDILKQTSVLSIVSFQDLPSLQIVTISITAFSTSGVPFYTGHDSSGIWKNLAEYSELDMLNFFVVRI